MAGERQGLGLKPYTGFPPKTAHFHLLNVKLIWLCEILTEFIIFWQNRFPTKQCIYCPHHLLRVSTLPCRNNIFRFLCCLKMKFAHELCWQTTKQCQSQKIVLIGLQAMFNMHEICQFVGRSHVGLGDCVVCLPPDYRSARLRSRRFRWFEEILGHPV